MLLKNSPGINHTLIPMSAHLGLDYVSGAFLVISPWLFGFADLVYVPHLVVGLFEIVAAMATRRIPVARRVTA